MEIAFYRSALEPVALAMCLFAAFQFYKTYKHYSTILISIGFLIAIVTHISVNYCIGIALLTDLISNHPYLCSPVVPYIKGFGYFLVGFGLLKLNEYLKSA